MTFTHWIHHLFEPHCSLCQEAMMEGKICQSCETLKMQLSIANHEKQEMLNTILSLTKRPDEQTSPIVEYEKIKPKMMTWNVRKQMLEAEDRKAAMLLAEQKQRTDTSRSESIEALEKELGIDEEVKSNA